MSGANRLSVAQHLAGLAFGAGITVCLAALWVYGLPFLRGTAFEDLSVIVYVVATAGVLTLADRIANVLLRR